VAHFIFGLWLGGYAKLLERPAVEVAVAEGAAPEQVEGPDSGTE